MPIEIRELTIKATISNEQGQATGKGAGSQDQAAMIAACVEQVLAILKEKSER